MKITNGQAVLAQQALTNLLQINLPMKASFDIAVLSTAIDSQVDSFRKARDAAIKNYQIKIEANDKGGFTFKTTKTGANDEETARIVEEVAEEFRAKVDELVGLEGQDITHKIHLPADANVNANDLKPILGFIEL